MNDIYNRDAHGESERMSGNQTEAVSAVPGEFEHTQAGTCSANAVPPGFGPHAPNSYSPSGWHNRAPQPVPPYKWDYNGYSAQDLYNRRAYAGKNRGLVIFGSVFFALLAVIVVSIAGRSIYDLINRELLQSENSWQLSSNVSGVNANTQSLPGITLHEKPVVSESIDPTGRLTTMEIARRVCPSVVGVIQYQSGRNMLITDSPEGSGIIITIDGYILTNAHVVQGAIEIKVILDNGEEYAAKLIGLDEKNDLAVIKIDANNLVYAELGNSDQVEVGEKVIAIGNPGGQSLAGSVTQGVVSALNRLIKPSGSLYAINCMQTDAAINPGNSGGPLVNEFGQVIGINSAKISANNYEGIGFAIPINDAKPIIDDLILHGKVQGRVALGITGYLEVTDSYSRWHDIPVGIMVNSVKPGSDLAKKGVGDGDIITAINGSSIKSVDDVYKIISQFKPGDVVTLTIFRSPTTFDVSVVLMEDN